MEANTLEIVLGLLNSGVMVVFLALFISGKIVNTKSRDEHAELIARRMSDEITKGIADAVKQGIVEGISESRNGYEKEKK